MKALIAIVFAIILLVPTRGYGFVSLPNEAQVIDSEDYYAQCLSSNPTSGSVCAEAAQQFQSRQEVRDVANTDSPSASEDGERQSPKTR